MKATSARSGQKDKNEVRCWKKQNKFVEECLQNQWNSDNPAIRESARDALLMRASANPDNDPADQCSNENFYKMHLAE